MPVLLKAPHACGCYLVKNAAVFMFVPCDAWNLWLWLQKLKNCRRCSLFASFREKTSWCKKGNNNAFIQVFTVEPCHYSEAFNSQQQWAPWETCLCLSKSLFSVNVLFILHIFISHFCYYVWLLSRQATTGCKSTLAQSMHGNLPTPIKVFVMQNTTQTQSEGGITPKHFCFGFNSHESLFGGVRITGVKGWLGLVKNHVQLNKREALHNQVTKKKNNPGSRRVKEWIFNKPGARSYRHNSGRRVPARKSLKDAVLHSLIDTVTHLEGDMMKAWMYLNFFGGFIF